MGWYEDMMANWVDDEDQYVDPRIAESWTPGYIRQPPPDRQELLEAYLCQPPESPDYILAGGHHYTWAYGGLFCTVAWVVFECGRMGAE